MRNSQRWRFIAWALLGAVVLLLVLWLAVGRKDGPGPIARPMPSDAEPNEHALDATPASADAVSDARRRWPRRKQGRQVTSRMIRSLQRRYAALFKLCYRRASARTNVLVPRKLQVILDVKRGGEVTRARVGSAEAGLRRCLLRVLRSWRFSREVRAQQVRFPIVFVDRH